MVTPAHACSRMGTSGLQDRTSLGKVPKTWWRDNIASNVRVATDGLLKLSLPEIGVRPWAQIKWGLGTSFPKRDSNEEKRQNHT